MAKTSSGVETSLTEKLHSLAAFEPQDTPVLSLYLDLSPNQHGRDQHEAFCRKAFAQQLKDFAGIERIQKYLADELDRSSDGLALFASGGSNGLFDAVQLNAPFSEHSLFVGDVPHIYPFVRLVDQHPRYATVLLDTNHAQILVFGVGAVEKRQEIQGLKTRRTSMGGMSQARYQRHAENFHLHHVKEVADTLDRIVRTDGIPHVVVAGDEVVIPLLNDALPAHVTEKIVDIIKLDRHMTEDEIAEATRDVLRQKDADTDRERVAEAIDAWRAGGLGVAGPEATLRALQMGQVDELLIAASPDALKPIQSLPDDATPAPGAVETTSTIGADRRQLHLSNELVTRAYRTDARVRMVEDKQLLAEHGGAAAMLRFRI